jgi:predicted enzyme related to lactoylglutathione lyase
MATSRAKKKSRTQRRARRAPTRKTKSAPRARAASPGRASRRAGRSRNGASPRKRAAKPVRSIRAATSAVASALGVRNHHMDYTSHAMDEVKRFYTELLGFGDFEFDPNTGYLYVRTGSSSSVGFMPPMPGPPEQWRPPREPAIYLEVLDVDRAHRELSAKGVTFLQAPTDMPWKHRVAVLRDPEGRTIMLAQPIAP